ncbi:Heterokaryon incompatibility [Hyaloscypha variabilis]
MILHTSLDQRPHYEALSYVWGTEKAPDPILLDGQPFYITENLKDALIMVRQGSQKERVLWIDAICINQNDLSERSAQVRQMRQIYSSAERVLV